MSNTPNSPSIQWYPGHMAKTRRIMRENLKHVDVVVELRDARIPFSSANPVIEELVEDKPRVILLAKEDLADPALTREWVEYFKNIENIPAMPANIKTGKGLERFPDFIRGNLGALLETREQRGISGAAIRMMIVGVPNVGKSSLINQLAGGRRLRVEDRPGVTLQKQWIKVEGGMELLDMPGVLWPKFEDPLVGENLGFTGAIKDDIMDTELLAIRLAATLRDEHPAMLKSRYGFTQQDYDTLQEYELVELLGRKRGMLISGGEIDFERASQTLLDEYRGGLLGRATLEAPPTVPSTEKETKAKADEQE